MSSLSVKVIVIAILLIVFLRYFGIVSLRKYLDRGVLVKVSRQANPGGVNAPSITVCPINPENEIGWKNSSLKLFNNISFIESLCGEKKVKTF